MSYILAYKNERTGWNERILNYKDLKDPTEFMTFTSAARAEEEASEREDLPPGTKYVAIPFPSLELDALSKTKGGFKVLLTYLNDRGGREGVGEFDSPTGKWEDVIKEVKARRLQKTLPASLDFDTNRLQIVVQLFGAEEKLTEITVLPVVDTK